MVKLTHSVCSGRNGTPLGDVEDAGAEEGHDHPGQHAHLEADVLDEVVVEPAPELDRLDDRREVVVGEDHRRGLLRDLGAGDAHGDADVGLLERRGVVDAVAGHGHDVPLALEDVDEPHLLLGRHAGDDADLVDLAVGLLVAELGELRAGDGAALDAELVRDRRGGDRVVAGDHPHLDAGRVGGGDRGLRRGTRRVDDADQRQQRQVLHQRQQVAARVERRGVEVPAGGRHHAQALRGEPLVLGEVALREAGVDRGRLERRIEVRRRAGEQLVGRALDEAADDLLPRLVGHAVERGHQLVGGVERERGDARVALARGDDVDAALLRQHDQRALGRVADHLAGVRHHGVAGQRQREHELLERDVRLAGDVLDRGPRSSSRCPTPCSAGPGSSARPPSSG